MVTAPDQGAQQLRSFANPTIQPTIRVFADGGFLGGGQSSPLPEGPMSGNPIQTAVSQAVDQAITNPVSNFANGGPVQHFQEGGLSSLFSRFADSLKQGGGEPIDIGGREAVISPEVYSQVTRPTYEERRDEAKRNIDSYEPPPPAASPFGRGVQRFFGQDAAGVEESKRQAQEVSDAALAREDALRKREALRSQYEEAVNKNPTSIFDYFGPMSDEELNKKQEARRQAEEAVLRQTRPSVSKFENPYGDNPVRESDERAQIEKMMPPPPASLPPPPPQREERSSISTELNKIREDRKAQSAADRRENALMALMSAGFGMAAGKSRHALSNIAEGGQQGIATFANLEKSRREDDNRRYLADLHERELRMNEPYKQAMTQQAQAQAAYLRAKPGIDQARLAQAARIADNRARLQAEQAVFAHMDKNPAGYLGANGKPDQMKIDAEIALRKKNIEPGILYDILNNGRQTDNSSGE